MALTKADRKALRGHLCDCELSDLWSDRLLARLLRSRIVLADRLTEHDGGEFATGGCDLIFRVDGGALRSGRLVHDPRSSEQRDAIRVATILGATLIGLRKGKTVGLATGGDVELVDIRPFRQPSQGATDSRISPGPAVGSIAG